MTERPSLIQKLEKKGYCASIVAIKHLEELGGEIRSLHDQGLLNEEFYHEWEQPYFHPLPHNFKNAKSIVIMAAPSPMVRTTIEWNGKILEAIVPPTYSDNSKVTRKARLDLKEALGGRYRLVRAALPQKLLAARSGLAMYGKNNITYTTRFGSFQRLTSFYTDFESPLDCWQEKKALPMCSTCKACMKACPTGAIQGDRFLIHVDRCLTYLNEKKSKEPFPKWVPKGSHNALIGCMRCQRACPYDRHFLDLHVDRGHFSEKEIDYLLKGQFKGKRGKAMERKLKRIGLDLTVFPRNLKALLGIN